MPQPAYVDAGAFSTGLVVSANGVSGLDIAMPTTIVPGNWLCAHFAHRASTNSLNMAVSVTAPSAVWNLGFEDAGGNMRQFVYYKFATGGESPLKVMVTAIGGTPGTVVFKGIVYQFQNVHNPGTATFIEAAAVSGTTVSGPQNDQPITTTGNDRLAVNLHAWSIAASLTPNDFTGETGGDWILQSIQVSGNPMPMRMWTATMATPGTVGGGVITGLAAAARVIRGFALAPCAGAAVLTKVPQMMHHYVMLRGA